MCPSNKLRRLTLPVDSPDSNRLIGLILTCAKRPVPLWVVSVACGSTDDPVKMNWENSPRLSTSLRMLSQREGMVCHSSIKRGVSPCSSVFGLISIIPTLWLNIVLSPRSRMLLACCWAVVVFPHHFGPSNKTAPLPANFRARSPSAILGLYFSFTIQNFLILLQNYWFYLNYASKLKKFGRL